MRIAVFLVVFLIVVQSAASAATLSTDRPLYKQGEKIIVQFTDPEGHSGAWIGLFEATAPTDPYTDGDAYDIAYEYTNGATNGVVEFEASRPGFFQIRFYNEDADINIATAISATFEVSTEGGRIGQPTLAFEKPIFKRGEHVKLHFTWNPSLPAGAWIGLFKNSDPLDGTENPDSYDISYEYVGDRTSGVWVFDAPSEIGSYKAAIVTGTDDWNPYCIVSMQITLDGEHPLPVADRKNPIVLSASKLHVGDELTVAFFAESCVDDSAWIGVMPASVISLKEEDNDYEDVNYCYIHPGEIWYWTIVVPETPGMYVVRIFPANESDRYAINEGVYFEVIPD